MLIVNNILCFNDKIDKVSYSLVKDWQHYLKFFLSYDNVTAKKVLLVLSKRK